MPAQFCQTVTDWAATGAMLQGLGTVGGAAAVLVAAAVGASTFGRWKAQALGQRHLEEAEQILTATYRVRDALSYIRAPMIWAKELAEAEEYLKQQDFWVTSNDARQRRMVSAQAIFYRIVNTKDDRGALQSRRAIALAYFGEALEKAINDLLQIYWLVQTDAEAYIDDPGNDRQFTAKLRRGMSSGGETNPYNTQIAEAVQTVEGICVPILRNEKELQGK
jgi:hypothetical protein